MKEFTQEKHLFNARHVIKGSSKQMACKYMKELIQVKYHMSVKHVRKDSAIKAI